MGSKQLLVLGRTIRDFRRRQGLSQEALAEKAGLHRTYIGSVERGERNLTVTSLSRIAEALGVRAADLLQVAR